MGDSTKIEWSAPEYEEREHTRDWFWALGVVVTTASVAAVIFGNYFFSALIIMGGVVLTLFATKKPEMVNYELDQQGLKARSNLYKFDNISAFWVQTNEKPVLFIKSTRVFLPVIAAPIPPESVQTIKSIFVGKQIPEEEMHEHLAERVLEIFGL